MSFGPSGSFESRSATTPARSCATSTQLPPLPPLYEDLRQLAQVRSILDHLPEQIDLDHDLRLLPPGGHSLMARRPRTTPSSRCRCGR